MANDKRVRPVPSTRTEKQRAEADQAIAERKEADDAFRANYERLKAEGLAAKPNDNPVVVVQGGCTRAPLRSSLEASCFSALRFSPFDLAAYRALT